MDINIDLDKYIDAVPNKGGRSGTANAPMAPPGQHVFHPRGVVAGYPDAVLPPNPPQPEIPPPHAVGAIRQRILAPLPPAQRKRTRDDREKRDIVDLSI